MGVPAFFRWLTKKYPSIVLECIEERSVDSEGQTVTDASQKNPNGVEFDNLYLDMNGIIHPCTHPENKPAPKNEDEMMIAIFECIDHMFSIVRPRKLLYMAIDGVAPRAKMNQQRSRRFRASKESNEKIKEIARIKAVMREKGFKLPPENEKQEHFDSNCITPGTPFMARLSKCLNYYIHNRLNNDPGWKGIQVILSDANVPGEGEHKIMDFIRRQRAQPHHNPNTQHCLCGADADLIMLGLATHEPNFTIIREEFQYNNQKRCEICAQTGHEMKECQGLENTSENSFQKVEGPQKYIFVRLNVLREYLSRELEMSGLPFEYDFERVIDDWVFMCFFVGNDFLPHLPSLEIREGAIDKLVDLYKKTVRGTKGFITDSGNVFLERVQLIMNDLGQLEDEIFRKRRKNELMFRQRTIERKKSERVMKIEEEVRKGNYEKVHEMQQQKIEDEEDIPDEIKLWEPGYKDRYYTDKFLFSCDEIYNRYDVAKEYVKGLCWVLKYYYQGCASWKWYYPYHYAPFASDFFNIDEQPIVFESNTKPFSPLEQLMGVFPAASNAHVPVPFANLMTDIDSPILDFYPEDFAIDLNGKKYAWQGVALLPFVDEERLKRALKPLEHLLTAEEKIRNSLGTDKLYVGKDTNCYDDVLDLNEGTSKNGSQLLNEGLLGTVHVRKDLYFQGEVLESPVRGLCPVTNNTVLCLIFKDPTYEHGFQFPAKRLEGAIDPPTILKPEDFKAPYRPRIGMGQQNQTAMLSDSGYRMLRHFAQPVMPSDRSQHFGHQNQRRQNGRGFQGHGNYRSQPSAGNQSGFSNFDRMGQINQQPNWNGPHNSKQFYTQMRVLRRGGNAGNFPHHNGGGSSRSNYSWNN